MKLPLICSVCIKDERNISAYEPQLYNVEVNDSGILKIKCFKGHITYAVLQNEKFELLFDMGIYAFQDGYNRESISSFAAALERFYEYSIRLFCLINNVDEEKFETSWKNIASQSERQYGAYCFLYLQTMGSPINVFSNRYLKLRNRVIHSGYIPDNVETLDYSKAVYDYISFEITKYKAKFNQYCQILTTRRIVKLQNEAKNSSKITNVNSWCVPTALNFLAPNGQAPLTFEEVLTKQRLVDISMG